MITHEEGSAQVVHEAQGDEPAGKVVQRLQRRAQEQRPEHVAHVCRRLSALWMNATEGWLCVPRAAITINAMAMKNR